MRLLSLLLVTAALVGHTTLVSGSNSPPTSPPGSPSGSPSKRRMFSIPTSIFGFGKKTPKPDKYTGVEAPPSDSASAAGLNLRKYGLPAAARKIMLTIRGMCATGSCEGVYRVSGFKESVGTVRQFIIDHEWATEEAMRGVDIPSGPRIGVNELAEGVKNYLAKKEEKLQFFVAGENREGMVKALEESSTSKSPEPLRAFFATQPKPLLASLSFFLSEMTHIIRKVPSSKMTAMNIGLVWGPALLPLGDTTDLTTIQKEAMGIPKWFENFINLYMNKQIKAAGLGLIKADLKGQAVVMGVPWPSSSPTAAVPVSEQQ